MMASGQRRYEELVVALEGGGHRLTPQREKALNVVLNAGSLFQPLTKALYQTRTDLRPFFQAWIYDDHAPARTSANGLD